VINARRDAREAKQNDEAHQRSVRPRSLNDWLMIVRHYYNKRSIVNSHRILGIPSRKLSWRRQSTSPTDESTNGFFCRNFFISWTFHPLVKGIDPVSSALRSFHPRLIRGENVFDGQLEQARHFEASGRLGSYFSVSMALMVWRETPSLSASSACDHSLAARSSRRRFFIYTSAMKRTTDPVVGPHNTKRPLRTKFWCAHITQEHVTNAGDPVAIAEKARASLTIFSTSHPFRRRAG